MISFNHRGWYREPDAVAVLKGGPDAPTLIGRIVFYQMREGVYLEAWINNIPPTKENGDLNSFHAFHIHEHGDCEIKTLSEPFSGAGGHWNPDNKLHPHHKGDLPPILNNNGFAYMAVLTDRFTVNEVIGKSIILHEDVDDFHSQPAGNAGEKIACGVIERFHP